MMNDDYDILNEAAEVARNSMSPADVLRDIFRRTNLEWQELENEQVRLWGQPMPQGAFLTMYVPKEAATDASPDAAVATTYMPGTEWLQTALREWRADNADADWADKVFMLDIDIKGELGKSYIRPRVAGDQVLGVNVPEGIDFLVMVDFPNYYEREKTEVENADMPYVYALLPVAEIVAYDAGGTDTVTVRTTEGCVFPNVVVIWPMTDAGLYPYETVALDTLPQDDWEAVSSLGTRPLTDAEYERIKRTSHRPATWNEMKNGGTTETEAGNE